MKDLLAVAHQPTWPAAPFLLLRFAAMLQVRWEGFRGRRGCAAQRACWLCTALHRLPASLCWPALPMLRMLLALAIHHVQGDKGLRHSDQHVRQYCLDLLASLAAQVGGCWRGRGVRGRAVG